MESKGDGSGPECGRKCGPVGGPTGAIDKVLDIEKEVDRGSDSDGSDSEDVDARVAYSQTIIDEIAETRKRLREEHAQHSSEEEVLPGVGHDNGENDGVTLSEDEVDSDGSDDDKHALIYGTTSGMAENGTGRGRGRGRGRGKGTD